MMWWLYDFMRGLCRVGSSLVHSVRNWSGICTSKQCWYLFELRKKNHSFFISDCACSSAYVMYRLSNTMKYECLTIENLLRKEKQFRKQNKCFEKFWVFFCPAPVRKLRSFPWQGLGCFFGLWVHNLKIRNVNLDFWFWRSGKPCIIGKHPTTMT